MHRFDFNEEKLNKIQDLDKYPDFDIQGSNDLDGFQIFTPGFIVDDMIKIVGKENINDFTKTVLEPASGDGAFTVRILESRLKTIKKDDDYFKKSLMALATIFSIEMDEELIIKQRTNIFSLLMYYANIRKENIPEGYIEVAKKIILTNFIWGESNIIEPLKLKGDAVGWYMPTEKGKRNLRIDKNKIMFANWNIKENLIDSTFILEEGESNTDSNYDGSELGGLFDV